MRSLLLGAALLLGLGTGAARPADAAEEVATFAGGCFWCMEEAFEAVPGVSDAVSGYTGGTTVNPGYHEVGGGGTGHAEAIEVHYDPAKVSYAQLLDTFWKNVDPLDATGQFCDRGDQYRSEIFYHGDAQEKLAEASKAQLEAAHRFKSPIVTKVVAAGPFYQAEDYHQDYYKKNPVHYKYYHWNCGRAQRLTELWGPAS